MTMIVSTHRNNGQIYIRRRIAGINWQALSKLFLTCACVDTMNSLSNLHQKAHRWNQLISSVKTLSTCACLHTMNSLIPPYWPPMSFLAGVHADSVSDILLWGYAQKWRIRCLNRHSSDHTCQKLWALAHLDLPTRYVIMIQPGSPEILAITSDPWLALFSWTLNLNPTFKRA